MMHEFLTSKRLELIDRCRAKVAQRPAPLATTDELEHGIPLFLDQLVKTLKMEQTAEPQRSREISGASGGESAVFSEIGETAARHGRELMKHGFTVEQVVHDYGDLCQAITDLAFETDAQIEIDEFRTLNRCLDNAIAVAVTEFTYQRDSQVAGSQANALNERLGSFSHELRNLVNSATLALTAIKGGSLGFRGATAGILERSLIGLRSLIDRSLTEVRMTAGVSELRRLLSLADLIGEIQGSAALEAQVRDCGFTVSAVDPLLAVYAHRDTLLAAVGNLLQNAFKFTRFHTDVHLNAYAVADRILIEVQDECGGLASGATERMFLPFAQEGADRTGIGLGLSISRRGVAANEGTLSVRDLPGDGCVFTIDLPRHAMREAVPVV